MNTRGWPQEWRDELDTILEDACSLRTVAERRERLLELLEEARRMQKQWVDVLDEDMRVRAADQLLKSHDNTTTQLAYIDNAGRLLNKPAKVGVRTVSDSGAESNQRALITTITWHQLRAVRTNRSAQQRSAAETIAMIDRLLELYELAPESTGPQDAADILGISLDQWLATPRVAAS